MNKSLSFLHDKKTSLYEKVNKLKLYLHNLNQKKRKNLVVIIHEEEANKKGTKSQENSDYESEQEIEETGKKSKQKDNLFQELESIFREKYFTTAKHYSLL